MLKRQALGVIVAGFVLLSSKGAIAQVGRADLEALKTEIEVLKEAVKSQTEAVRQLQELTRSLRDALLRPAQAPPGEFTEVVLGVDGAAFQGKSDAKVTIVEFSDYQCPFCARHSNDTFPQIDRDYIRTGQVKYVFLDFPIESLHPHAFKTHEAVHCAGEQGKRREMHEKVFSNQRAMSMADLAVHAQALGLDMAGFQKCLATDLASTKIRRSLEEGQKSGVTATPTFFLGLTEANSPTLRAVRKIEGAEPYGVFRASIEELLSSRRAQ